ncbi:phosphate ABC transporter permease [Escherichia coli]|uniref:Phosphate ABC transporter permease n=1 Tax=Escherichia coli TaxID=562 RepID=A0A376NXR8_ECOLX|nr:phosphate ABC transporter permease [Escherichia coli]
MAMVEMQTTAALAESRRKMQARRRLKNRIALTLSMATMAFGLFWLIWILMSTITRGIDGMSLALFTEMTPPPNTEGGGLANALAGSGLLFCGPRYSVRRWALWRGFIWRNMVVNPGWQK